MSFIPEYKFVERGDQLQALDRYVEAAENYLKAINKGLNDDYLWSEIANCFFIAEENEKARQAAETALALAPDKIAALLVLAGLDLREGNIDAAEKTVRHCLELDSDDYQAKYYLISIYLDKRLLKKAESLLDEVMEEVPEEPLFRQMKIRLLALKNDIDAAHIEVDAFLEENPSESAVIAYKAALELDKNQYKKAEALALQALAIDPQESVAKFVLLGVYKNNNFFLRFFVGRAFNTYILQWNWMMIVWFIIAAKSVFIWGGFFVFYLLITWVGGVLYNTIIRYNNRLSLLLTEQQVKQSNLFVGMILLIGVLSVAYHFTSNELVAKGIIISVFSMFVAISYFELVSRRKKTAFTISSILFFLMLAYSFPFELGGFLVVAVILLILHGVLFTFRLIGE